MQIPTDPISPARRVLHVWRRRLRRFPLEITAALALTLIASVAVIAAVAL